MIWIPVLPLKSLSDLVKMRLRNWDRKRSHYILDQVHKGTRKWLLLAICTNKSNGIATHLPTSMIHSQFLGRFWSLLHRKWASVQRCRIWNKQKIIPRNRTQFRGLYSSFFDDYFKAKKYLKGRPQIWNELSANCVLIVTNLFRACLETTAENEHPFLSCLDTVITFDNKKNVSRLLLALEKCKIWNFLLPNQARFDWWKKNSHWFQGHPASQLESVAIFSNLFSSHATSGTISGLYKCVNDTWQKIL